MRTTIFYKTDNSAGWQMMKLQKPKEECEKMCKEQNFTDYKIMELTHTTAQDLHLLTDIVVFENKYYFSDDEIPYPTTESQIIQNFDVSMVWEEENEYYETDYDEVYNEQTINWGWGNLWTNVITKFSINKNMDELGIVAQGFVHDIPAFLEKLNNNKQAVYHNDEYSPFIWLAWIKDDKVRLIHQDYRYEEVNTEFDVLMDKEIFYNTCNHMLEVMQEFADKDLKRYNEYIKKYEK